MNFKIFVLVSFALVFCLTILFAFVSAEPAVAQVTGAAAAGQTKPGFSGYRGVNIGMSMDEARAKLGEARTKSDQEDYYVFSEGETAQVLYEPDHTIKAISTTYFGANVKPPSPMDIFGAEAEVKADGSINKMVKYPKVGYWISYIRTDGADAMVMVTVHKLQKEEQ